MLTHCPPHLRLFFIKLGSLPQIILKKFAIFKPLVFIFMFLIPTGTVFVLLIPQVKHMTLTHFNKLSTEQQQKAVLINGVFLAERKDPPLRMMLYDMENFYVEVFFLSRYNKVAWFNGFKSTRKLEAYLQKIDVTSVLEEVLSYKRN